MKWMIGATLMLTVATNAQAVVPEGVQEIAGELGNKHHRLMNCAFWANEAAAAVRSRSRGIKEQDAEDAVPIGVNPTDSDSDLAARRTEVIAQAYESDDLQRMSPKQLHDAVFAYCKSIEDY